MAYLNTPKLDFPFEKWEVNSCKFKERCVYDGIDWGLHLGEDCDIKPGTTVKSIGRGKVMFSALCASKESPKKGGYRNWGNIIIIAHKNPRTKNIFYSLYGHLGERLVEQGDKVELGQKIGTIAPAWTQKNGWWEDAHLHLAICIDPLKQGKSFPGYWKEPQSKQRLKYWTSPTKFIKNYKV
jgi:murein DD-endopeptidase MepM/ murein hydrolase activator NlpD